MASTRSARNGTDQIATVQKFVDVGRAMQADVDKILDKREGSPPVHVEQHYVLLSIDEIFPSKFNPRKTFDEAYINDLAESIRIHGVIQPIAVRHRDIGRYEIIVGECRWRASKIAGRFQIPAIIREVKSDAEHMDLALVENLKRRDLDPIEEARGYKQLLDLGNKVKGVAAKVNRSSPAISNALRLLDLPEDVQEMISTGKLSKAHGVALAGYKEWPRLVSAITKHAVDNELSAHAIEKGVPHNVAWNLEQGKKPIALRVGYTTLFDKKVCETCPFNAGRRIASSGDILCLKPDHYRELQQAAIAVRDKQQREQAKKKTEKSPQMKAVETRHRNQAERNKKVREQLQAAAKQWEQSIDKRTRELDKGGRLTTKEVIAMLWDELLHEDEQIIKALDHYGVKLPKLDRKRFDYIWIPSEWLTVLEQCSADKLLKAMALARLNEWKELCAKGHGNDDMPLRRYQWYAGIVDAEVEAA